VHLVVALRMRPAWRAGGAVGALLHTGAWFAMSGVVYSLVGYLVSLIVIARAGSEALGLLRAFTAVIAPLSLLSMAAETWGLREVTASEHDRVRIVLHVSLLAAFPYLVALASALTVPTLVVRAVIGETYVASASLMVPVTAAALVGAFGLGPVVGLRALKGGRELVFSQIVASPARIVAAMTASAQDMSTCAWGLAGAELLRVSVVLRGLQRTCRRESEGGAGGSS
jgi:hypothetical protein